MNHWFQFRLRQIGLELVSIFKVELEPKPNFISLKNWFKTGFLDLFMCETRTEIGTLKFFFYKIEIGRFFIKVESCPTPVKNLLEICSQM
jgi:hypothetical protein